MSRPSSHSLVTLTYDRRERRRTDRLQHAIGCSTPKQPQSTERSINGLSLLRHSRFRQEVVFEKDLVWFLQNQRYQGALRHSGVIIPNAHRETVFNSPSPKSWPRSGYCAT